MSDLGMASELDCDSCRSDDDAVQCYVCTACPHRCECPCEDCGMPFRRCSCDADECDACDGEFPL